MVIEFSFLSPSPLLLKIAGRPATFIVTAFKLPVDVEADDTTATSFKIEASKAKGRVCMIG